MFIGFSLSLCLFYPFQFPQLFMLAMLISHWLLELRVRKEHTNHFTIFRWFFQFMSNILRFARHFAATISISRFHLLGLNSEAWSLRLMLELVFSTMHLTEVQFNFIQWSISSIPLSFPNQRNTHHRNTQSIPRLPRNHC